jgi:N-acetylneuraminic acid mutarotase
MRLGASHGMSRELASVLSALTVVILSTLTGCETKIPEGKYSCENDDDCPADWRCQDDPVTKGARRCYRSTTGDGGLPTSPPARYDHEMATLGNKVLLFGGMDITWNRLNDTWEWDGSNWSKRSPSTSPPERYNHAMATLGNKVLLFGGIQSSDAFNDTWEWDGSNWTEKSPSTSPPARFSHAMATLGDKVLLFGGATSSDASLNFSMLTDTWEWDGSNWTEKSSSTSPPGRFYHAMTTLGDKILLFGGAISSLNVSMLTDTWEWDGSTWSQKSPSASPSARSALAMTTLGNKVLLFGGLNNNPFLIPVLNDTWEWDGSTWSQKILPASPPLRFAHAMATLKDKVLLFGGLDSSSHDYNDTWAWDGKNWSQKE